MNIKIIKILIIATFSLLITYAVCLTNFNYTEVKSQKYSEITETLKKNYSQFQKDFQTTFTNILTAKVQPKNGKNIFFIETSDSIYDVNLNARQCCAIESAALMNPDLHIFILFASQKRLKKLKITLQINAILSYHNVHINYLNVTEISAGSPMEDFIKSDKLSESDFRIPHSSGKICK
jgi:predicted aspartyl protease